MSLESRANEVPLDSKETFRAIFGINERILQPYKDRSFVPGLERARNDASLYALNSLNQCYLALIIHGENIDLDEKRYTQQWISRWLTGLTAATNQDWLTLSSVIQTKANLSLTTSAAVSNKLEDATGLQGEAYAIDLEEEGGALMRLASFLKI